MPDGSGWNVPSNRVNLKIASNKSSPATKKRVPPVHMGGQVATNHLVPTVLPPHKMTTSSSPPAMLVLFFDSDTRRKLSQSGEVATEI